MTTNQEIGKYTLSKLKDAGADAAQCIVSQGKADELNADGGEFSLMRSLFTSSLTMKALVGGKKGVASINVLDKDAIDEAVKSCVDSAQSAVEDIAEMIAPGQGTHRFEKGLDTADKARLFERLEEFMQTVGKDFPKIIIEQMISSFVATERTYMNTNGTELTHKYGGYTFEAMFSAHEGEVASSFNGVGVYADDLDKPFMELGMLRQLLGESEQQLVTKSCEGKFVGTLLISPACIMEILSSVLGNCVTDTVLIDGTSPWKAKLGQKVVSDKITLRALPYDDRVVFGERFTADGYVAEAFDIIKDGVLESFMLSQYGANKTGNKRAKCSGQTIDMSAGDKSLDEIIAGIDRGILLNRFSGGQPGVNGDFSGVAKNSFLIENGKIAGAVTETMISGNLLDMLNNVIAVSKERICDGSSILPWAAFGGITVSGNN